MKHKLKVSVLLLTGALILAESPFSTGYATPPNKPPEVQVGLEIGKARISGGETTTGRIVVRRNGNTEELIFRLENSNPNLVRLSTSEITLKPAESSASFDIFSASTPIRSSVTIRAFLLRADQVQTQKVIEIVSATLKGVTLSQPTLNGTDGSKITCRVELNAKAPTGGIELYRQLFASPGTRGDFLTLDNTPNPRVEAGNKDVTFDIRYEAISVVGGSKIRNSREFSSGGDKVSLVTRTVELIMSLEQQTTTQWKAISGIASKVTFDVIPLRVASTSVQPTPVTGGAEALATFTLNFPAGASETVGLQPVYVSSVVAVWARHLGSSCSGDRQGVVDLPLTQGVATYTFKVCTAPITTPATGKLMVRMRTGVFPVPITLRP